MNLTLGYGSATADNGNLISQTIAVGPSAFTAAQSYAYDGLNRLTQATEGTNWKQGYGYDRWGNRWIDEANTAAIPVVAGTPKRLAWYDGNTKNQLDGVTYDQAGNGSPVPGKTFKYDVENRLVAVVSSAALSEAMVYDGEGRRVKRTVGSPSVATTYVYDAFGQLAQEYGGLANTASGRSYVFDDHLGSVRMRLGTDGAAQGWWDYAPFGEEVPGAAGARSTVSGYGYAGSGLTAAPSGMFTGQVRDRLADGAASGLDYFGARYMSAAQGRFTSPDPIHFQAEMLTDPQRFNLYAYVRNNPLRYIDPKGEAIELVGDEEERKKVLQALASAVGKQAGSYLYENKITGKDGSVKYFVGVKAGGADGKGPEFGKINSVAGEIGTIISDTKVVNVGIVASGTTVRGDVGGGVLVAPYPTGSEAVTGPIGGGLGIRLLDPSAQYGRVPGPLMSNGLAAQSDAGLVLGHELGHARGLMTGDWRLADGNPFNTDAAALRLENKVRENRNLRAPQRLLHHVPGLR